MRLIAIVSVAAVVIITAAAHAVRAAQPVHEVSVVAKKFAFEPAEIQVVAGEPVRLVVRSSDSVHGFAIPSLKIDLQVPRGGDPVVAEFMAPPAGRYDVACSEFCGRGHGQMKAALVSTAPVRTSR
jgi:cytochrome c oxidase subunit 2